MSSSSPAPSNSSAPASSTTPPPSSSPTPSPTSSVNGTSYAPPTGNNGETRVVDDSDPSITYNSTSGGSWSIANNTSAYNHTIHQTSCKTCPATLIFNGTGLSLTSMLYPNGATFFVYLDNAHSGPYILTDPLDRAVVVFAVEGLSAGNHNATFIKNSADPDDTMFNIDSITVISRPASSGAASVTSSGRTSSSQTQASETQTSTTVPVAQASSNDAPIGAIVGGTVGGVLVLVVVVLAWMFLSKRKKASRPLRY